MNEAQAIRKLGRGQIIFISSVFLIVGIILSFLGIRKIQGNDQYATVVATVVEAHPDETPDNTGVSYTIFTFTDLDGNLHENVRYDGYSSFYKVGKEVKIKYNINNPNDIEGANDNYILLIIGVVFLIFGAVGVVGQIKRIKTDKVDDEYFEKSDSKKDKSDFDLTTNKTTYYFHPTKGLAMNFVLEDEDKNVIYDAITKKYRLFSPSDYEFVNHLTGRKIEHKVGKKTTTSVGDEHGYRITSHITTDVFLKIDGEDFKEIYKRKNIFIDFNGDVFNPAFELYISNQKVAQIDVTSVNQTVTEGFKSKLKAMGYFKVVISNTDLLDDIFFALFLLGYMA